MAAEARAVERIDGAGRFADEGSSLELRALTIGQHYSFGIESFDENGVFTKTGDVPPEFTEDRLEPWPITKPAPPQ